MKKVEYTLNGLDCANCAAKIQDKISQIDGVKNVNLDFMTKKLRFYVLDERHEEHLLKTVQKTVDSIESGIKVTKDEQEKEESIAFKLFEIAFSSALFISSLLVENNSLSLILVIASYVIIGYEVIISAFKNIFKGKALDESFLMTIATIGAFFIKKYTEGVAVMLFYQIGEFFQALAVNRSRKSINKLMDIRPDYANLKSGSELKKVSPESVSVGDIIVVKPGERIPLDGVVLNGSSSIDTSALTGESLPREIDQDDEVLSGSINLQGVIEIIVTKPYSESTVSRIIDLVSNASSKKSVTEKFITRFARIYTPVVVITAVALALVPPVVLGMTGFSDWLYRALIFLVISCPCALVISVPLSFFGGIGGASRSGILIKGANSLDALSKVEIVAFDKTGTLTEGKFSVSTIDTVGISREKLLETAAHIESFSNHPIAKAIIEYYGITPDKSRVDEVVEIAGKGISGRFDGQMILAGNAKLLIDNKIDFSSGDNTTTVIYFAVNGKFAGSIEVADTIRKDARKAIGLLAPLGVARTALLTGDRKKTGIEIAGKLGIKEAYTELLPQDKVQIVETLLKKKTDGKSLVFVGDGINDAPVLARADVGIAMGGLGADSAIEAADVVLMTDELKKIATAIRISKKTIRIAKQNIVFSLAVKILVLILGATGNSTMWMAVFADVGVSLIAIINSLRALKQAE